MDFVGPPLADEKGIGALTLAGFIREVCERHADREALCFREPDYTVVRWTYAELQEQVDAVARALLAAGVGVGTRVALLMGNRPEWVACAYGVTSIGAVLVPVNTYLEPPELEYVLAHSAAAVLLCQSELAGHKYEDDVKAMRDRLPFLREVYCLGTPWWDDFISCGQERSAERSPTLDTANPPAGRSFPQERDDLAAIRDAVSPYDDAMVIYTSGTTAQPKAVLHGHRAPALQSWRFVEHLCLDQDVRAWSAFPFFWTAGFCMVMGGTLAAGGCCVLQERFDAGEALRLLEVERVTTPYAWPHQTAAMEDHAMWPLSDLSAIRQAESYGPFGRHPKVSIPEDSYSPRSAYGSTETFTIVTSLPADTPVKVREGNHGAVLPGNTIRIVDPDTGKALARGKSGEIRVKGATLMKGYLKQAPEDVFGADGFFRTGDAGFVDKNGMLHWTGRSDDMIKTGGANVSPVEVEEVLLRHPDLAASVVVGVPDETYGEIVVLLTAPHDGREVTEEGIQSWLSGRVASYKIPRHVICLDEGTIQRAANAKLGAHAVRALATEALSERSSGYREVSYLEAAD